MFPKRRDTSRTFSLGLLMLWSLPHTLSSLRGSSPGVPLHRLVIHLNPTRWCSTFQTVDNYIWLLSVLKSWQHFLTNPKLYYYQNVWHHNTSLANILGFTQFGSYQNVFLCSCRRSWSGDGWKFSFNWWWPTSLRFLLPEEGIKTMELHLYDPSVILKICQHRMGCESTLLESLWVEKQVLTSQANKFLESQPQLFDKQICDTLQQKVPYGPCYELLVWCKYYSVISVQQSFQVKRFNKIECKLWTNPHW